MCSACVLRMDHHCPWVVGCVGFRNHKYFLNFLVYASLTLAYVTVMQHEIVWSSCMYRSSSVTALVYNIMLCGRYLGPWLQPMVQTHATHVSICSTSVIVNYASIAVLLGSVGFFACFHVFISARNVTTIEFMDHLNGRGIIDHFRVNVSAVALSCYAGLPCSHCHTAVF